MLNITFQNVYQTSTTPAFKVGTRAVTPDGREWVFTKANTALAKGSVAVPAAVTTVTTVSSAVDALGRIVYIDKVAAGWTTDQFVDGWVVVNTGTGIGQAAKIKSNSATRLELYPETALATALAVADSGIAIRTMALVDKAAVTSKIQSAVGIAQVAFAASDFGWLLTNGEGSVLAGEVLIIGSNFVTGDDTTGQVLKGTTAKGPFDEQSLGIVLVANGGADQLALVRAVIR